MKTDVLIVGGGPGGAATAMFLVREGIKPVIIEAETFPRYHIGESMTGAGGKVLRDLGLADEMYNRKYPTKQGVKVYGQSGKGNWFVPVTGRDENWKLFEWDTWQGRRSDFDNMVIFYQKKYHWGWFIPLDEEVVSVGIVCPSAYFLDKKESKRDFYIRELRELHPELSRRIPEIKLVEDVHVIPNYSYQVNGFCGKGFICIGDAHRFIDPIFSFGLTVTMREGQFVAPMVRAYLEGANRE